MKEAFTLQPYVPCFVFTTGKMTFNRIVSSFEDAMGKIISVSFLLVSGIAVFFIRNYFVYNITDNVNNIRDVFFFVLAT